MAEEITNSGYGFACRIDNIKEASEGNRVISGCAVTEQATPAMAVDVAAGTIRIDNAYVSVGATSKNVNAADATYDRYDIIEVGKDGTVDYSAGTASANPLPPDLSANHILLAVIFVENNSTTVITANISDGRIVYEDSGVQVPIGGIIAWAKTLTGVPSLPTGFVECDGSVLSDTESPLNGQTIPDLNGGNRFLRGNSTSGGTGGSETNDFAHTHSLSSSCSSANAGAACPGGYGSATGSALSDGVDNKPPYYEVVWIMRVK